MCAALNGKSNKTGAILQHRWYFFFSLRNSKETKVSLFLGPLQTEIRELHKELKAAEKFSVGNAVLFIKAFMVFRGKEGCLVFNVCLHFIRS